MKHSNSGMRISAVALCFVLMLAIVPFSGCINSDTKVGGISVLPQTDNVSGNAAGTSSFLDKIKDSFSGTNSISENENAGKNKNSGKITSGKSDSEDSKSDRDSEYDSRVVVHNLPEGFSYVGKVGLTMDDIHNMFPETRSIDAEISAAKYTYDDNGENRSLYFAAIDLESGFMVNAGTYLIEQKMADNRIPYKKEIINNTVVYYIAFSKNIVRNAPSEMKNQDTENGSISGENVFEDLYNSGNDNDSKHLNLKIWPNDECLFITMTTMEDEDVVNEFVKNSGMI